MRDGVAGMVEYGFTKFKKVSDITELTLRIAVDFGVGGRHRAEGKAGSNLCPCDWRGFGATVAEIAQDLTGLVGRKNLDMWLDSQERCQSRRIGVVEVRVGE